jgi:hypothetical protein
VPINVDDLERGNRQVRRAVLDLLRQDPRVAYSAEELTVEVGFLGIVASATEIELILTTFVNKAVIIRETVDQTVYFRYDDRFGLRPPR